MLKFMVALLVALVMIAPTLSVAQNNVDAPVAIDRSATGGAQTLEDILARQRGEKIDDSFRSNDIGGDAALVPQLAPLGPTSDAEVWRALRYNKADVTATSRSDVSKVIVQDGGMRWLEFRHGPLVTYGGWFLLGVLALLALFFLIRGRVKLDEEPTGRTVTRFKFFERFSHWTLAGSFILLGITGLTTLLGRMFIAPYLGKEVNAALLTYSKLIHNSVAWAFILALISVFVLWVVHNIPDRTDITWFKQAGGIIGKNHPPAKKFNAGQKIIFWSVILLGTSISVSGLSLLFPYELPLFAKTFGVINDIGLSNLLGLGTLPTELAPQEEMQLAQLWHAIVAFVLLAIIFAHIYIGTIGMEGAYDAMGNGEVDEAWAHQHHSIWLDEVKEKGALKQTPAE